MYIDDESIGLVLRGRIAGQASSGVATPVARLEGPESLPKEDKIVMCMLACMGSPSSLYRFPASPTSRFSLYSMKLNIVDNNIPCFLIDFSYLVSPAHCPPPPSRHSCPVFLIS